MTRHITPERLLFLNRCSLYYVVGNPEGCLRLLTLLQFFLSIKYKPIIWDVLAKTNLIFENYQTHFSCIYWPNLYVLSDFGRYRSISFLYNAPYSQKY